MENLEAIGVANYLGPKLRELRMMAGKTQNDIAEQLSVDQARVSMIEKGTYQLQISTIVAYCQAIGIDPFDFMLYTIHDLEPSKISEDNFSQMAPELAALFQPVHQTH